MSGGVSSLTENQDPKKKVLLIHTKRILFHPHRRTQSLGKRFRSVTERGYTDFADILLLFDLFFRAASLCALGINAPPLTTEFQVLHAHVTHLTTVQSRHTGRD